MSRRAARKAAVLGSPIAHSRSPQLHLAAYRALGLHDWTYERIECTADELPALVGGFGPRMGRRVGDDAGQVRRAAVRRRAHRSAPSWSGSANTLVRTTRGWRADNTDVDGVVGALGAVVRTTLWSCSGRAAPRRRRSWRWPSSASTA